MNKPFCAACEKNRQPILSVLKSLFSGSRAVLEVGSGTGQHAAYFAEKLPHLIWYTSDLRENHVDIQIWLDDAGLSNTPAPLELDVTQHDWPVVDIDTVFSANTVHIMHWHEVEAFFSGAGHLLPEGGIFTLYGPFNYGNQYTSESNKRFDHWLKERDPASGIRNFEDLNRLANDSGLFSKEDIEMPANNRILCWEKRNT